MPHDLDAAKVVCADAVLRLRTDLQVSYTNRFFNACEYLEMQILSRFVWAIQRRYRCASIIWLHDGVWMDLAVSAADIATAEQEALAATLPQSAHTERLFRTCTMNFQLPVKHFLLPLPCLIFFLSVLLYPHLDVLGNNPVLIP